MRTAVAIMRKDGKTEGAVLEAVDMQLAETLPGEFCLVVRDEGAATVVKTTMTLEHIQGLFRLLKGKLEAPGAVPTLGLGVVKQDELGNYLRPPLVQLTIGELAVRFPPDKVLEIAESLFKIAGELEAGQALLI